MANLDKSKMQEYLTKAAEDAARWNAAFNREKREERRYVNRCDVTVLFCYCRVVVMRMPSAYSCSSYL